MGEVHQNSLFADFENAYVSVVVPVFNEAPNIVANLGLLLEEMESSFRHFEILVMSDGSTDGTNQEMFRFQCPEVKIKIFPENTGKGAVIREGFRAAQGDYILFIDGGMELHPREIRIFIGLMILYECDIVIGSKRHPQSKIDYPWFRKVLSWIYQKIIHQLFQVDVTDTQVGMKLFRKEVVQAIEPYLEIDRYGFDLELLSLAKIKGFKRIMEAPIQMNYFGKNKRPLPKELWHVFRVGLSLMKDTWRLYRRLNHLEKTGQLRLQELPDDGPPRKRR
ncbi:MAG: glycosyltransferase family 2 protein [Bdellovibrionales bacterium]|nr:glycosyltransferase family 2 protein [Bdellovibrionales bacterium]